MNKLLFRDTLRTVKKHFSRYLSILLIVALGTAFFVGIKATAPDMLENAANYFTDCNLADIRIRSSIGLTEADMTALSQIEGVEYVSGEKYVDAFVYVNGEPQQDIDGTAITTRAYGVSPQAIYDNLYLGVNDGAYMNRVQEIEGSIPRQKNECLVDASRLSTPESFQIGNVITLKNGGGEIPEELNTQEFTIVGVIRTPYYLSFERGNTDIGSGKLGTYIVIPSDAFSTDYYTEVSLKLTDAGRYEPFSDEYIAFTDGFIRKITDASPSLIASRVTEMRPQLALKISNAETQIAQKEQELTSGIEEIDAKIAALSPYAGENGSALLAAKQQEFDQTFANVESEYSNSSARYQLALEDYTARRQTLEQKEAEYASFKAQLDASQALYDTLNAQYTAANNQIASYEASIAQYQSLIDAAQNMVNQIGDTQANAYSNDQIQRIITMMQATYPDLYSSVRAFTTSGLAGEIIVNISPYLEDQKAKLAQEEKKLAETKAQVDALGAQLEEKRPELQQAALKSSQAQRELQQAQASLNAYMDTLIQQGFNIPSSGIDLLMKKMEAEAELNQLKSTVAAAPGQIQQLQQRKEEIQTSAASSLEFAKTELADAKALFSKLDEVTWSIFDRNDAPGYMSYGQSVNNIEVLSNIFPLFFFIISSLVCLSTVTRMVEEDRVVLGTYKALGYGTFSVLLKYVTYALSACVIGSAVGIGVGVFLFPYMINSAYSVMYSLPDMAYRFPLRYALIGFGIALFSTAFVTVAAVLRDLRLKPSVLMRPKSPKKGKKILLERIRFFWRTLSFTSKVTARNLFRNKSRFLMTLAGVAGCTALLLASLGFYNSISAIKLEQYDAETAISKYDIQIVFDEAQASSDTAEAFLRVRSAAKGKLSEVGLVSMKSMIGFGGDEKKSLEVYVFVPEKPKEISNFIDLRSRATGEKLTLDDSGAVITEMLANATNTGVGDTICFKNTAGKTYGVKVRAIAENYTFNYIYMTPALYEQTVGSPPEYTYAIGNISDTYAAPGAKNLENMKGQLAKDLMKLEGVTTVAYLSETTESIGEITNALSLVILVFFVSALILAFVVLYNLANINIIERTRELATLKVLGFNDTEIHRYILRENLIVSLFGVAFGVLLGVLLHKTLITYTAIDTVMYGQKIYWYSYALAVGITALFIAGVNLLLRRKTVRIDMVESLKSVE